MPEHENSKNSDAKIEAAEKSGCPMHNGGSLKTERHYPTKLRDVTHKQMDGISDLVVWAPIKEGFIDAFGNVTYESRLRIVAEALNKLRRNVREFQLIEPFADPTKRILSLLDFRIGVVERDIFGFGNPDNEDAETIRPRQYMYLTATFDGPWEPYMRQIWHPMGAFLDLVLCNCEGYLPATQTNFEDYVQWVRDHSLDTGMFYLVMGQTVKDHIYLEALERHQRETMDAHERDVKLATLTVPSPDDEAQITRARNKAETLKLALEALNVLYQLTRYYPLDSSQEKQDNFLLAATKIILQDEIVKAELDGKSLPQYLEAVAFPPNPPTCELCSENKDETCNTCREMKQAQAILLVMKDQFEWYDIEVEERMFSTPVIEPKFDDRQIQKGLLSSYDEDNLKNTGGATLLLKITDAKKVKRFIDHRLWSWEGDFSFVYRNLAFTNNGLKKLPLTEKELRAFPKEFRQGMEERAGLIGDMHYNHPQRWTLPLRNGKAKTRDDVEKARRLPRVSLSEIDLIVQLRGMTITNSNLNSAAKNNVLPHDNADRFIEPYIRYDEEFSDVNISGSSLKDALPSGWKGNDHKDNTKIIDNYFGVDIHSFDPADEILKITKKVADSIGDLKQPTLSLIKVLIELIQNHGEWLGVELVSIEHSFRSGISNPPDPKTPTTKDHFGFEDGISQPIISNLNYDRPDEVKKSKPMQISRGDLICGFSNLLGDGPGKKKHKLIQKHGSFLAIRKIRQNVESFENFLDDNSSDDLDKELVAAKLMGRFRDGRPLIGTDKTPIGNDFNYKNDGKGLSCPFVSHIRRANPREVIHKRKTPKILRRGMSYGNRYDEHNPNDTDRGIIFIAYCSNLAEQYEVVQRWVNGGNSSHVGSAQFDPILTPQPQSGRQVIKYAQRKTEADISDDPSNICIKRFERDAKKPFTVLEWGVYGFVPSKKALERFCSKIENDEFDRLPVRRKRPYNSDNDLLKRIERGGRVLKDIEALTDENLKRIQWKIILEDYLTKDPAERDISNDVWAYISEKLNGVYRIASGVGGHSTEVDIKPVILITDKNKIHEAWSNHDSFSNNEIGERLKCVFADHYIGRDPSDNNYKKEAKITNSILLRYPAEPAFKLGYGIGQTILKERKLVSKKLFGRDKFKIELTREYFAPALAELCRAWFGIPDKPLNVVSDNGSFFESGAFDPDKFEKKPRLARCPGDFLAPSRGSFYPRPTETIWEYAKQHGPRLREAINGLMKKWKKENKISGGLAYEIFKAHTNGKNPRDGTDEEFDLLGRNIVGAMIGMLPSSEASLRGAIFEWIDQDLLWSIQGELISKTDGVPTSYEIANKVISPHLKRSMSKRPAPDLLHRNVVRNGQFHGVEHKVGDTVFLSLVSALMTDLETGNEEDGYLTVFGGKRSAGNATDGENPHACPATNMAMGSLLGILTALFESGRIQALPASLILEISDYDKVD